MLYRSAPKIKDELSILGYGGMRFPEKGIKINEPEATRQLRGAIDKGLNYIDTAWIYHNGESESFLGRALKDGYREKVKIADKLPQWLCEKPEDLDKFLNAQLDRLQDKVIDYYLIHAVDKTGWEHIKALGAVEFLDKAKADGKITYAGFSFHGAPGDFAPIVDDYDWDFCQIQYNILDENSQAGKKGLKYAASRGLAVMIMEPLRGGTLTMKLPKQVEDVYKNSGRNWSNAEWALRWLWDQPEVTLLLSGMNNDAHIEENIRLASEVKPGSLSEEDKAVIDNAVAAYRKVAKVGCTGCQYCMPCPAGVNIPYCFDHYNNLYISGRSFMTKGYYWFQLGGVMNPKKSLASQCINCGKCTKHCPQQIDIPKELKNVKKALEGPFIKIIIKVVAFLMRLRPKK